MMTEKEVIKRMIVNALGNLRYCEEKYGMFAIVTIKYRAKWSILDELWNKLYYDEEYQKKETL